MTTESSLLAAIIAKPDDDQPRLVYADWLEENGQAALDAYSRAAIEWARSKTSVGGYHVATTEDACTTTSL